MYHRIPRISILLVFVLTLGSPMGVYWQVSILTGNAYAAHNRFVVFEAFMRST